MNQKGLAPILIVLILAALIGGYLVYQNQAKPIPPQTTQSTPQPSPSPTDVCLDKKTYRSLEDAQKEPNKVCYLDLSNKNLTELPKEILQFDNLHDLYLNYNKITSLPNDIKNLKNLKSIDLTGNPITKDEVDRIRTLIPTVQIFNIQPMNPPQ